MEITMPRELQELAASLMPRSPNYRYFTGPRGEMYCWSTERVNGKFCAWTYSPVGKGARSGKPRQWHVINRVNFKLRKVAKARALARYKKAMEEERNGKIQKSG